MQKIKILALSVFTLSALAFMPGQAQADNLRHYHKGKPHNRAAIEHECNHGRHHGKRNGHHKNHYHEYDTYYKTIHYGPYGRRVVYQDPYYYKPPVKRVHHYRDTGSSLNFTFKFD